MERLSILNAPFILQGWPCFEDYTQRWRKFCLCTLVTITVFNISISSTIDPLLTLLVQVNFQKLFASNLKMDKAKYERRTLIHVTCFIILQNTKFLWINCTLMKSVPSVDLPAKPVFFHLPNNSRISNSIIGSATKWLRILSLPPNDKILMRRQLRSTKFSFHRLPITVIFFFTGDDVFKSNSIIVRGFQSTRSLPINQSLDPFFTGIWLRLAFWFKGGETREESGEWKGMCSGISRCWQEYYVDLRESHIHRFLIIIGAFLLTLTNIPGRKYQDIYWLYLLENSNKFYFILHYN